MVENVGSQGADGPGARGRARGVGRPAWPGWGATAGSGEGERLASRP